MFRRTLAGLVIFCIAAQPLSGDEEWLVLEPEDEEEHYNTQPLDTNGTIEAGHNGLVVFYDGETNLRMWGTSGFGTTWSHTFQNGDPGTPMWGIGTGSVSIFDDAVEKDTNLVEIVEDPWPH